MHKNTNADLYGTVMGYQTALSGPSHGPLGLAISRSTLLKNNDYMRFENTIFNTTVKRFDNIDLKFLFWVKITKRDLIMLQRISYHF